MIDPETYKHVLEHGEINLCGASLTIPMIEFIITVLSITGNVNVKNCATCSPALMEFGAYLAELSKEAVKV